MFQVNTHIKISFGDWLYFLGYQVYINSQPTNVLQPSVFFEIAKSTRFRFNDITPIAAIDFDFQYGNYHLSKIGIEDFKQISASDVQPTIEKILHQKMGGKIAEDKMETALDAVAHSLSWMLAGVDEVYKLDVENAELESKKAPFATHPLFCSFLAIFKEERKGVYLELGSD